MKKNHFYLVSTLTLSLLLSATNVSAIDLGDELVDAADKGDLNKVSSLLKKGYYVDNLGDFGVTALMRAAYRGDGRMVDLLLKEGAYVNASDIGGETALHLAAKRGDQEIILRLIEAGAEVDYPDKEQWTPLMRAVMAKKSQVVDLLVDAGADISKVNSEKESALFYAVSSGQTQIVNALLGSKQLDKLLPSDRDEMLLLAKQKNHQEVYQDLANLFGTPSTETYVYDNPNGVDVLPGRSSFIQVKDPNESKSFTSDLTSSILNKFEPRDESQKTDKNKMAPSSPQPPIYSEIGKAPSPNNNLSPDRPIDLMPVVAAPPLIAPQGEPSVHVPRQPLLEKTQTTLIQPPAAPYLVVEPQSAVMVSKNISDSAPVVKEPVKLADNPPALPVQSEITSATETPALSKTESISPVIEKREKTILSLRDIPEENRYATERKIEQSIAENKMTAPTAALPTPPMDEFVAIEDILDPGVDFIFMVQLGVFTAPDQAAYTWHYIQSGNRDLLGDFTPVIKRAILEEENKVLYRLRVGKFIEKAQAGLLCEQLKSRKVDCFVIEMAADSLQQASKKTISVPESISHTSSEHSSPIRPLSNTPRTIIPKNKPVIVDIPKKTEKLEIEQSTPVHTQEEKLSSDLWQGMNNPYQPYPLLPPEEPVTNNLDTSPQQMPIEPTDFNAVPPHAEPVGPLPITPILPTQVSEKSTINSEVPAAELADNELPWLQPGMADVPAMTPDGAMPPENGISPFNRDIESPPMAPLPSSVIPAEPVGAPVMPLPGPEPILMTAPAAMNVAPPVNVVPDPKNIPLRDFEEEYQNFYQELEQGATDPNSTVNTPLVSEAILVDEDSYLSQKDDLVMVPAAKEKVSEPVLSFTGEVNIKIQSFTTKMEAEDYYSRMFEYNEDFSHIAKIIVAADTKKEKSPFIIELGPVDSSVSQTICDLVKANQLRCEVSQALASPAPAEIKEVIKPETIIEPKTEDQTSREQRRPVSQDKNISLDGLPISDGGTEPVANIKSSWIELGTFANRSEAEYYWMFLLEDHEDILGRFTHQLGQVVHGAFGAGAVQLQIGPFDTQERAENVCRILKTRNVACLFN